MRVQRVRKPAQRDADYTNLFFFDRHYALSTLYCQEIRYDKVAVPRIVGSVCPPVEEQGGEAHAAYKLMLFSRVRCPGPGGCADPLTYRSALMPNDKPDDTSTATLLRAKLKAIANPHWSPPSEAKMKPSFRQCWKACQCEFEYKASVASEKEKLAEQIAVIADTTTMKYYSGGAHPAAQMAFRFRPILLQLLAVQYDKHVERLPDGIVELADLISRFLCGCSCYHLDEQLHLSEFAALQIKTINDSLDMDLLVRMKPFKEEKQGGLINDVDSDEDKIGN